jgi:hypothetical protein
MCTYHTERVEVTGSGKGPDGWFPLRLASVYLDHPQHALAEHTLNIDFLNPAQGPSARVARRAGRGVRARPRRRDPGRPRRRRFCGEPAMTDQYVPGTCNIGPAEIAIRRRVGHAGLVVTAALATALLRSDLRPPWRLTLAVPAAGAASGYLQARRRFCANFGFRGVYNFDARGHEQRVMVDQALAADRRRALQITAASAAIGLGVALGAMLVPSR